MGHAPSSSRRNAILAVAEWSAYRLFVAEVCFFRRAVFAHLCPTRAAIDRAFAARASALIFREQLEDDLSDLVDLGLGEVGRQVSLRCRRDVAERRRAIRSAAYSQGFSAPAIPWASRSDSVRLMPDPGPNGGVA